MLAAAFVLVTAATPAAQAERQRGPDGRLWPNRERFPGGIEALADYVHGKGLKFGIYTSAGTLTCAKTMPGALDHEDVDARTFAGRGVDHLKYDALKKTSRPIVFSIREWGRNKPWEWGARTGHLWRTTGDIKDNWAKLLDVVKKNAPLDAYAGLGHWNDPLLSKADGRWVFAKLLADGDVAVALFNEGAANARIGTSAEAIGLPHAAGYRLRDVAAQGPADLGTDLGSGPPHGHVLYRVHTGE